MDELCVVGKSIPRPDAWDKVMGKTRYVDDITLPGMAYAAIYYSSLPHAEIKELNIAKALRVPGVLAILRASDIPGKNFIPMIKEDWTFFAKEKVVYPGEPIALIVAESKDAIMDAWEKISVVYEELPAIFDPEESLKPGAPQINPIGNLLSLHKIRTGDLELGFMESDVIIEGVYETDYQEHAYLETQGALAVPGAEGGMTIYGSMQCPFYVLKGVCMILGLPQHKVRIVQTPTGGAFGGKEDMPSLFAGLAALAAWSIKRPVKLTLDRRADIIMTSKRHPSRSYYRLGAKKDGTLMACEARVYLDPGAYATLTPSVLWRCCIHSCGPYRIPHVKVDAYAGATNKVPCGAYRGFGSPQVIFAMERQMDKLAREIAMDPLKLRAMNALRQGDSTVTGQTLPWSVGLEECIQKAAEASRWEEKRSRYPAEDGYKRRGIGCSFLHYGVGLGAAGSRIDVAEAYVQIKPDGGAVFAVGTTDMGQGMQGVLTQIVAEGLGGIAPQQIQMLPVDTMQVGDSGPTVASRATYTSGNAILDACEKIMDEMKKGAALLLKCEPSQVRAGGGKFFQESAPEIFYTFAQVAAECSARHFGLTHTGYFKSPDTSWDSETGQGKAYVAYSFGVQIAEAEVDMQTGEARVLDIWAAHDLGKVVNPKMAQGQIEGGVVQGVGYSLMEFIALDGKGRIQNPSFSNYIIPTSLDAPLVHSEIVESVYPEGPFGVKGFGETPLMGVAACVANAVSDAIGRDVDKIPMLPERLLEKMKG